VLKVTHDRTPSRPTRLARAETIRSCRGASPSRESTGQRGGAVLSLPLLCAHNALEDRRFLHRTQILKCKPPASLGDATRAVCVETSGRPKPCKTKEGGPDTRCGGYPQHLNVIEGLWLPSILVIGENRRPVWSWSDARRLIAPAPRACVPY